MDSESAACFAPASIPASVNKGSPAATC
jgi:hypothetical protein